MSRTRSFWGAVTLVGALIVASPGGSAAAATGPLETVSAAEEAPDATAWIVKVDDAARTAVISGVGVPGASITAVGPAGPASTTVTANGDWALEVAGLVEEVNEIKITQLSEGVSTALTTVYPHIGEFPLILLQAKIANIDGDTVSLAGHSRNGSTITVTTPAGEVYSTVALDRLSWSLEVPGLPTGEQTLIVHEIFNGQPMETIRVTVTIGALETPNVGALAGAALLFGGLGAFVRRRRASSASECPWI